MAKKWVSQDVYNAMTGVASDKNEYEYLDSVGATKQRDEYGKAAASKYDVINAYSPELRQTIKYSNAQQTRDLLKDYGVARDSKTIASDIIAKKFGYENTKAKNPNADLSQFDATDLYDELNAVDPSMATMLRNMNYQQAIDWQKNGTMPNIYQPEAASEVKKRTENEIVADIAKYKFAYEDAKAKGLDYKPFEQQVTSLYDELGAVNPSTVALVKGMDYNQTNAWLSGEKPTVTQPPKQQSVWDVGNTILGFKLGYEGGMKNGVQGFDKNYYNAQPYYEQLRGMGPEGEALAATLEGMNAQEAKAYLAANKPKTPMTGEEMHTDAYTKVDNHGNNIYSDVRSMYFDDSFGQGTKNNFNLYGGAKANQAAANAAAQNGGNYDSFADYNKNSTDLSYRIAGENAVQKMRESYGNWGNEFINTIGNQLRGAATDFSNYDFKKKELASNEKVALDTNATTKYGYDTELEGTKYATDSNERVAKDTNETTRYGYDKGLAGTMHTNETNKAMNIENNRTNLSLAEIQAESEKEVANINAAVENNRISSEWAQALLIDSKDRYIADLNYKLQNNQITSNEYIEGLKHGAELYGYDVQKEIAKIQANGSKGSTGSTSTSYSSGTVKKSGSSSNSSSKSSSDSSSVELPSGFLSSDTNTSTDTTSTSTNTTTDPSKDNTTSGVTGTVQNVGNTIADPIRDFGYKIFSYAAFKTDAGGNAFNKILEYYESGNIDGIKTELSGLENSGGDEADDAKSIRKILTDNGVII